jgi:hypothetical protein
MKEQLRTISLLIIFTLLLACSKESPQALNLFDKGKRYNLSGFSLKQPQEGNWSLSSNTNEEIVFVSGDKSTLETLVAKASVI